MFTKVMKEELIAGLLKIFGNNISMIILYGSVARNEYTDESDIDIAVVVERMSDNYFEDTPLLWKLKREQPGLHKAKAAGSLPCRSCAIK